MAPVSLSTHLCRSRLEGFPFPRPRSTSIPDEIQEDTAQVDMVQGLLLRIALVHPKGAHLADAADQGLRHSMKEIPGAQVLVIILSLLA